MEGKTVLWGGRHSVERRVIWSRGHSRSNALECRSAIKPSKVTHPSVSSVTDSRRSVLCCPPQWARLPVHSLVGQACLPAAAEGRGCVFPAPPAAWLTLSCSSPEGQPASLRILPVTQDFTRQPYSYPLLKDTDCSGIFPFAPSPAS